MELFSLKNKVVIVTGASGLLGREHVDAIAMAGGIPVMLDLDQAVLDEQVREISQKYNIQSSGYAVDITKEEMIVNNCLKIIDKYKKIDGLVNNAANNPKVENNTGNNFSRLEYFPIDIWDNDINVSLKGTFLCLKHYGNAISRNPIGGSIVNISSDLGLIAPDQRLYKVAGLPEQEQPVKPISYSVVKTGLIGITRYVATYWADKNIRCNAICPGGVENNQNAIFLNDVVKRIPLNRMASKDEYKGVLVFLLSDASSYVTGAVIAADGGRSVW